MPGMPSACAEKPGVGLACFPTLLLRTPESGALYLAMAAGWPGWVGVADDGRGSSR